MDYDQAVVVGTQTFGKGIVQHLLPLGDGTAIKLTVSDYYTPGGTDLHKKGLGLLMWCRVGSETEDESGDSVGRG